MTRPRLSQPEPKSSQDERVDSLRKGVNGFRGEVNELLSSICDNSSQFDEVCISLSTAHLFSEKGKKLEDSPGQSRGVDEFPEALVSELKGEGLHPSLDTPTNELFSNSIDEFSQEVTHREDVARLLREAGFTKLSERFSQCGNEIPMMCGDCRESVRMGTFACGNPICEDCARRKAAKLAESWVKSALQVPHRYGDRWRMITLTLVVGESIEDDADRILSSLRELRKRWKQRNKRAFAGFWSREVGSERNVHLHMMVYCPFIPQKELSKDWLEITGDSSVVHIQQVKKGRKSLADAMREVCKYITKLGSERTPEALVEIFIAMKGKASGRAFGSLHGTVKKVERKSPECDHCGGSSWWPARGIQWMFEGGSVSPDCIDWSQAPPDG